MDVLIKETDAKSLIALPFAPKAMRGVGKGGRFDKTKEIHQNDSINELDKKIFGDSTGALGDAGRGEGLPAESAEAFLRRSHGSGQSSEGGKNEILSWARGKGRVVNRLPWRLDGPKDVGGGEHHAFFDPKLERWVKLTKGSGTSFGRTLDLRGKNWSIGRSTALEYLERIRAQNETFGDDIALPGVYEDKHGNVNIISSQSHKDGSPVEDEGEIQSYMEEAGFHSMGNSAYYREGDNTLILDLHAENAVKVNDGNLRVFDAITLHPTEEQLARLRSEGAIPKNTTFSISTPPSQ